MSAGGVSEGLLASSSFGVIALRAHSRKIHIAIQRFA